LIMESILSSETSILTRAKRSHKLEVGILDISPDRKPTQLHVCGSSNHKSFDSVIGSDSPEGKSLIFFTRGYTYSQFHNSCTLIETLPSIQSTLRVHIHRVLAIGDRMLLIHCKIPSGNAPRS
jgi:hypothetical protein